MKKLKCAVTIFLLLALIFAFVPTVFATNDQIEGTVKIMSYNVAGLPFSLDAPTNQYKLGSAITQSGYDIVAVQEDFNFHGLLTANLDKDAYPYQTVHTGGVPGGDGVNIYSEYKIYNEKRITWENAHGVLDAGADELTPKGILFAIIDLGNGIFIDFYNIHADAAGTDEDVDVRTLQFKQLAKIIKERNSKNPVIITGDFNASIHYGRPSDSHLYYEIYRDCGFHDAWFEVKNGGQYGFSSLKPWIDEYGGYSYPYSSGKWNSIEKVLYKSGDNIELKAKSQEYVYYGDNLSDHPAVLVELEYRVIGEPISNGDELEVVKEDSAAHFTNSVTSFFKAFSKIIKYIFTLE